MGLSVVVTGGAGFLGAPIVDALLEQHPHWNITIFDLKPPPTVNVNVTYETGDVTDLDRVYSVLRKARPTVVIHTAGMVPKLAERYGRQLEARIYDTNVNGTRNMLLGAANSGAEVFVWTGSCTAITDKMSMDYRNIDETWPTSTKQSLIYGESKAAAEKLVLEACTAKFATCALRPSVIFGPDDYQLIPSVHACIEKGETPFVIGHGENLWDVTYVTNVADAHVLACDNLLSSKTAAGEAIFIANEEPIPFRMFCLAIWKAFGHYPPFEIHVPRSIASFAGYIAEWKTWLTGSTATLSRGSVRDACATRYCNGSKARRLLGYKPRIGIEEGIQISCNDYAARLKADTVKK